MYYEAAKCASFVRELEGWIRRKLGCIRLKQCKRVYILQQFLERQGVKKWQSWTCVFWERMVAKVRHTQSPTGHGGQHGSRNLAYTVCH